MGVTLAVRFVDSAFVYRTSRVVALIGIPVVAAGAVAVEIPASAIFSDVEWRARAIRTIEESLGRERDVVISLPHSADENDHRVAGALGDLLVPFARRVGGVVATGGDTATALLRAWGITTLRLVGEIEPGVPVSISTV